MRPHQRCTYPLKAKITALLVAVAMFAVAGTVLLVPATLLAQGELTLEGLAAGLTGLTDRVARLAPT